MHQVQTECLHGPPGILVPALFSGRASGASRRGVTCRAHPAQGSSTGFKPWSSQLMLFTGNASLALLSSHKSPTRSQTLLPPSKFLRDRPVVLAMRAGTGHGPLGLGQCSLGWGPCEWVTQQNKAAGMSAPSFPAMASPVTGRLPQLGF